MAEANELVELIRGRIHAEFDGECHLTDTEAHRIANFLSEAEKREREARVKALEEAAQVADRCTFDEHALAQATDIGKAVHHQSVEIAVAIRALQSEER